jgi:hypothetical protein
MPQATCKPKEARISSDRGATTSVAQPSIAEAYQEVPGENQTRAQQTQVNNQAGPRTLLCTQHGQN